MSAVKAALKREEDRHATSWMNLRDARICCQCDTIHDGAKCPRCMSAVFIALEPILNRTEKGEPHGRE